MMFSTLFSATCYIKTQSYQLRIGINDDCNEFSTSTIDDILLKIDTDGSTANILSSIQLHFESLTTEKINSDHDNDDTAPEIIPFSKLLTIKLSSESNSSTMEQRSEWFSSQQTIKSSEISSSESTHVDLSYIDISESFLWSVKRIQLEMDTTAARQLCQISTQFLSKLKHRPRHLLVFINPQCGKGKQM